MGNNRLAPGGQRFAITFALSTPTSCGWDGRAYRAHKMAKFKVPILIKIGDFIISCKASFESPYNT